MCIDEHCSIKSIHTVSKYGQQLSIVPGLLEEEVEDIFSASKDEAGGDDVSRQFVFVGFAQFDDQLLRRAMLFEILSKTKDGLFNK